MDNKWTASCLESDPTTDPKLITRRRVGRPKVRWTDDINKHIVGDHAYDDDQIDERRHRPIWMDRNIDTKLWIDLESSFVNRAS